MFKELELWIMLYDTSIFLLSADLSFVLSECFLPSDISKKCCTCWNQYLFLLNPFVFLWSSCNFSLIACCNCYYYYYYHCYLFSFVFPFLIWTLLLSTKTHDLELIFVLVSKFSGRKGWYLWLSTMRRKYLKWNLRTWNLL